MGIWAGQLFANDHACDVRDALVTAQIEQINAAVRALEQTGVEARAATDVTPYERLVTLDERVLAPAAIVAALVDDGVVGALPPEPREVARWHMAIVAEYAALRREEEQADQRPPMQLYNVFPGQSASADFWRERERQTERLFERLARAAGEAAGTESNNQQA